MIKVVILTEGGKNVGFGHISRCTAFYQAFEDRGITPEFIINGDDSVLDILSDKKHRIFNWLEQKEYLIEHLHNVDIIIVDSYLAKKKMYTEISNIVKIPVFLDDNMRIDYPKGIVVNGTIYANMLDYPKIKDVKYLLGPEYSYLRKEFWSLDPYEIKPSVNTIMITLGGTDPKKLTSRILKKISNNFPEMRKIIIIGNGEGNDLSEIDRNTEIIKNASAGKMKDIMMKSDIAITAAGQTSYELCRIGLPMIAIETATNQKNNINNLLDKGLILQPIKWDNPIIESEIIRQMNTLSDYSLRVKISKLMKNTIRGDGVNTIVDILLKLSR